MSDFRLEVETKFKSICPFEVKDVYFANNPDRKIDSNFPEYWQWGCWYADVVTGDGSVLLLVLCQGFEHVQCTLDHVLPRFFELMITTERGGRP